MSPAEYRATLAAIGVIARMTLNLDLVGFIESIDRAESAGVLLDPTLYQRFLRDQKAQADLTFSREAASKLREIQKGARTLAELHGIKLDAPAAELAEGAEI